MEERFNFSRALIKLTGRAFLFTVAWIFIACRAIVASPGESWVACALVIAGIVTALNITGDKIVDAIATAIGNAKVNVDLSAGAGKSGASWTSGCVAPIPDLKVENAPTPDWTVKNPPIATYGAESVGNGRMSDEKIDRWAEVAQKELDIDKGKP
jgi:hypothetical protein